MKRSTILTTMLPHFLLFVAERYKSRSHILCIRYPYYCISAVKLNEGDTDKLHIKIQSINNLFFPTSWTRFFSVIEWFSH